MQLSAGYDSLPGMNRPGQRFVSEGAAPARFTAAEFMRMAELGAFADMKVELDHGELVRMTPPMSDHGAVQARVIIALSAVAARGGFTVYGEVGINLGEDTIRACDAALVRGEVPAHRLLEAAEVELAVEVSASTLDVDLGEKLRDYAAAGIPLYWVVDTGARVVHVMRSPQGKAYAAREVVRFGEPLELPGGAGTILLD
ncbi:MAG TPA: Uma2 family endonuclease [Allosphingosinicella sp.]|jgi:Uma2 family endonuclease